MAVNEEKSFVSPDFTAPLNIEERYRLCPADATCKGMFFSDVVGALKLAGLPNPAPQKYLSFKDYTLREFIAFSVQAVALLYPDQPVREGLRRLGQQVYPAFASTLMGKMTFGVLGRDIAKILQLAPSAFDKAISLGSAEILILEPKHVRVALRDLYTFADSYQIGVWEGAFHACLMQGCVTNRIHDVANIDLDFTWD